MSDEPESLARLTFNAAATREVFADEAKGLRLRIERGKVSFRSATVRRGVDVIAIERRARGVTVPVDQSHRVLLQRLFRAGLSEERPFFTLEPMPRGWFGIIHYPEMEHPPRLPMLTVSGFQPPPVAIDMVAWRRFQRILASDRPIDETLWQDIRRMVAGAVAMTARPSRGRPSSDRLAATRLLDIVRRNVAQFVDWGHRQPEFLDEINDLMGKAGISPTPEPIRSRVQVESVRVRDTPEVHESPEVHEPETEEMPPAADDGGPDDGGFEITTDYVAQVVQGQEPKPKRGRRKSPRLAPVILEEPPWAPASASEAQPEAEEPSESEEPPEAMATDDHMSESTELDEGGEDVEADSEETVAEESEGELVEPETVEEGSDFVNLEDDQPEPPQDEPPQDEPPQGGDQPEPSQGNQPEPSQGNQPEEAQQEARRKEDDEETRRRQNMSPWERWQEDEERRQEEEARQREQEERQRREQEPDEST